MQDEGVVLSDAAGVCEVPATYSEDGGDEDRAEAGRDPDKLGIDATVLAGDRGSQAWAAEAEQWQAMGATHLPFRTMAAGMTSNDQHIEAIRKFREVWPAK